MAEQSSVKFWLISDLDDTIKISNTNSKLNTIFRGLFRSSAFAGMPELYQELVQDGESSFHIVSSSPPAIRKNIERFLSKNKFPKANLILRDWIRQHSILEYKIGNILKLIEVAPIPVILVGDDTQYDPDVFLHARERFPEKILATYVRTVSGRELPDGLYRFFTAFDLACAELSAGRLTSEQVLRVGEAVLRAKKNSRLIPGFSLKPPLGFTPRLPIANLPILELWGRIQARIESMHKRKSKP